MVNFALIGTKWDQNHFELSQQPYMYSGKIAFGAKIGQKTVFGPNFWPNYRFFMKITQIRQSHYELGWCTEFQENPNFWYVEKITWYENHHNDLCGVLN